MSESLFEVLFYTTAILLRERVLMDGILAFLMPKLHFDRRFYANTICCGLENNRQNAIKCAVNARID